MTTVLWAHRAAWGPAADGAEEEATSHRTAPRAPRRGRPESGAVLRQGRTEAEAETNMAGADANATACMV